MKKAIWFMLCISLVAALCACTPAPAPEEPSPTPPAAESEATASEAIATPPSTSAAAPSPVAKASSEPTPTAPSGPEMYSSYAHLVSFDPATGVAQFDYFDMLRGDEAADFLVEHEGYTQAEALSYVEDFADSEFVEKNLNNQLRAIDIDTVSLSLMFQPSGAQVEGAEPVPSTASDFRAIYALDPSLLLDSFFYYIHVEEGGHVSLVEQVYWP